MLTWFTSWQRRWRHKVSCSQVVHQGKEIIGRQVCTVHCFSIWTSGEIVVLIEQTGSIESNGRLPGPVEVATLICEDCICLGRVVCDDDGLVAVHLQQMKNT